MDGTLFKISADKKFASIGKTEQEAVWYEIEPHVEKFVHSIPLGTEVGIKSEKKDNKSHLVFIVEKSKSKFNKAPNDAPTPAPVSAPSSVAPQDPPPATPVAQPTRTPEAKSTNVQDSIKRQAVGKMVAASLVSLQGQLTPVNIKEVITDLYTHYQSLVG